MYRKLGSPDWEWSMLDINNFWSISQSTESIVAYYTGRDLFSKGWFPRILALWIIVDGGPERELHDDFFVMPGSELLFSSICANFLSSAAILAPVLAPEDILWVFNKENDEGRFPEWWW